MSNFTTGLVLYLVTIIISVAMILWETSRIKVTKKAFFLLCLQVLSIIWLITGTIENLSSTNEQLFFSIRFTLFPIYYIGPVFLIFAMNYANVLTHSRGLNRSLLSKGILAVTTFFYWPVLTKHYFYLVIEYKDISNIGYTEWGPFFMMAYRLSILYLIIGTGLIIYKRTKEKKHHPNDSYRDLNLLFIGIFMPFFSNIMSWVVSFLPSFDVTPLFFAVSNVVIGLSVVHYNLLNTPVADIDGCYLKENEIGLIFDASGRLKTLTQEAKEWLKDIEFKELETIDTLINTLSIDKKILQKLLEKKHSTVSLSNIYSGDLCLDLTLENITVENRPYGILLTIMDKNAFDPDGYFRPREYLEKYALPLKYLETLLAILNDQSLEASALKSNITYGEAVSRQNFLCATLVGQAPSKACFEAIKKDYKDSKFN